MTGFFVNDVEMTFDLSGFIVKWLQKNKMCQKAVAFFR